MVGNGRDGRGAVVEALVAALAGAGARVGGFVQRTRWSGDVIEGYDLVRAGTDEVLPLAREDVESPELCRWTFAEDAFDVARRWVLEGDEDVVFVEAGRLEAAKRGHWETLIGALEARPWTVLAIRRGVLASVALELPDPVDAIELPASEGDIERFLARVRQRYAEEASR